MQTTKLQDLCDIEGMLPIVVWVVEHARSVPKEENTRKEGRENDIRESTSG